MLLNDIYFVMNWFVMDIKIETLELRVDNARV
jgi:hypothetical protein